ncbi:MAG: hypothetical protein QXF41_03330, partial [Candidatus Micrarchaeaceae archaeon]
MTQYNINLSDAISPADVLNYTINVNPANLYGIISRIIQLANIPAQNIFIGEQIKTIDYART